MARLLNAARANFGPSGIFKMRRPGEGGVAEETEKNFYGEQN